MLKRILTLSLSFIMLISYIAAGAQSAHLVIIQFPDVVRPGKTEVFKFRAEHEGTGTFSLADENGRELFTIQQGMQIPAGEGSLIWNGFSPTMQELDEGKYLVRLRVAEDLVEHPLVIGKPSPQIKQLMLQDAQVIPGQEWEMNITVNMPGTLLVVFHVAEKQHQVFNGAIPEGATRVTWDGLIEDTAPPAGFHTLSVVFLDEGGFPANQQHITLEVMAAETGITDEGSAPYEELPITPDEVPEDPQAQQEEAGQTPPDGAQSSSRPVSGQEGYHYAVPTTLEVPEADFGKDFWRLPVGDYDEEAIWKVMMQPITVLWGKAQRDVYRVRATPDASTKRENVVGEVHYESQGVHVLEQRDDGWSYVEVYNSSYGPDNRTRRGYGDTDDLIRGYIHTSELRVIEPRTDYGILIDKLKQRMYIFKEGKIFTELLISTGVPTKQQPWNETPSGEFLMVSRTGDFNAGNLVCRMSMRINGGALIHEVPYILNESTGYWDYSSQEAQLGKKASHGCIRVQRLNNNDGINMSWLWNNIKVNTKVLVWDDDNRYYDYPDNTLALYFNPTGGRFYHLDQNCRSIKDRYLPLEGALTYAELDNSEFAKLTPCAHCNPPLRASQIDQINRDNGF